MSAAIGAAGERLALAKAQRQAAANRGREGGNGRAVVAGRKRNGHLVIRRVGHSRFQRRGRAVAKVLERREGPLAWAPLDGDCAVMADAEVVVDARRDGASIGRHVHGRIFHAIRRRHEDGRIEGVRVQLQVAGLDDRCQRVRGDDLAPLAIEIDALQRMTGRHHDE